MFRYSKNVTILTLKFYSSAPNAAECFYLPVDRKELPVSLSVPSFHNLVPKIEPNIRWSQEPKIRTKDEKIITLPENEKLRILLENEKIRIRPEKEKPIKTSTISTEISEGKQD